MITEELLRKCRIEFEGYLQLAAVESPENHLMIQELKAHSQRVAGNSILLANSALLSQEDKHLTEIIALLHDIGKVEMIISNAEISGIQKDHALVSVKVIRQMEFFCLLTEEVQSIVLNSVEHHNKVKLPKLDTEQQTLFARLLRDADKLDIYDSSLRFFKEKMGFQPLMTTILSNTPLISDKILKSIQAGKSASVDDLKTMNDYKLFLISMTFDLNFKYTFRIMSEKQYVQKIYETLPKRDQIIEAYRGVKLFIENKFVL